MYIKPRELEFVELHYPFFEGEKENRDNRELPPSEHVPDNDVKEKQMAEIKLNNFVFERRIVLNILKENISNNQFIIQKEDVQKLCELTGLDIDMLLKELVPIAKERARPPISDYKVGAVALGGSGTIYMGVNLEFSGFQLNQTVHGEQFVATLAQQNGETSLRKISLSAAPCGHCRQFLNELDEEKTLQILTPENPPTLLSELLPKNFGPMDLGIQGGLMAQIDYLPVTHEDELVARALEGAQRSYAPYSDSPSAVAIEINSNDKIYLGTYGENAAFNPTLPPLQAALIALVAEGHEYNDIIRVVLVEKSDAKTSHELITRALIAKLAPKASFFVVHLTL